jgi:hypothetical protein
MKLLLLGVTLALACNLFAPEPASYAAPSEHTQMGQQQKPCKSSRLIAHIEHNGLSFAISVDSSDDSFLDIDVPQRSGTLAASSPPTVKLKVLMADDTVISGTAQNNLPWAGNGGWDEITYQFGLGLGRHATVDAIQSVTISVGDESYTAFPF